MPSVDAKGASQAYVLVDAMGKAVFIALGFDFIKTTALLIYYFQVNLPAYLAPNKIIHFNFQSCLTRLPKTKRISDSRNSLYFWPPNNI